MVSKMSPAILVSNQVPEKPGRQVSEQSAADAAHLFFSKDAAAEQSHSDEDN